MSVKLGNGLVVPDEAVILDMGSRGEQAGKVDYAIWFIDMASYKGEPAVILQVTQHPTDPPVVIPTGVILTRSMLQQMLVDIQTRPRC